MTGYIFQDWLRKFNCHVKQQNKHVALLIDNAPSHIFQGLELSNTSIIALPPNMTSRIQPMDAGIIQSFKCHYRQRFVGFKIEQADLAPEERKRLDVLGAINFALQAWAEVEPGSISNCFLHTNVLPIMVSTGLRNKSEPRLAKDKTMERLANLLKEASFDVSPEEYASVDDGFMPEEPQPIQVVNPLSEEEEEDDDSTERKKYLVKDVLDGLETINGWLQNREDNCKEELDMMIQLRKKIERKIEANKKQKTLLSFFSVNQ